MAQLADLLREDRDEIIAEWETLVGRLASARELPAPALRDHMPDIVFALADELEARCAGAAGGDSQEPLTAIAPEGDLPHSERRSGYLDGLAGHHGEERASLGFDLQEVVLEYGLLRTAIVRRFLSRTSGDGAALAQLAALNAAVDQLIADALARYVEVKERARRHGAEIREEFLGILGHDLRTPLGAILTGAQALARSGRLHEDDLEMARRMVRSGKRMQRMVTDLLDFARLRLGGGLPVATAEADLGAICRGVAEEVRLLFPTRSVVARIGTGGLRGCWDRDRLAQAVENLLSNALQHGRDPIELDVRARGDEAVLEVANAGPAIDDATLQSLFEPLAERTARGDGSLGFGLYIVRGIVEAHRGTIDLRTSDDQTVFAIRLPRDATGSDRRSDRTAA